VLHRGNLGSIVGLDKPAGALFDRSIYEFATHSKIVLVNRKARMGRNPATGETIKIAAKRVVKFRVAKAAKDAILGGK